MIELYIAFDSYIGEQQDGKWSVLEGAPFLEGQTFDSEQELRKQMDEISSQAGNLIKDLGIIHSMLRLVDSLLKAAKLESLHLRVDARNGIVIFPGKEMLDLADTILFLQSVLRSHGPCDDPSCYPELLAKWQKARSDWRLGQYDDSN